MFKPHSSVISVCMLTGCAVALLGHAFLLRISFSDWQQTPISELSSEGNALQHGIYLVFFALGQGLMAVRINYPQAKAFTRCIQVLALINALLITGLAYAFTLQNATLHTVCLSIIASVAGFIMAGLVVRGFRRREFAVSAYLNGLFLLIWLGLIPAVFFFDENSVGAYQRYVGMVYLLWICLVAVTPDGFRDNPIAKD